VLQLLPVMNEFQVERMSATRSRRMALVTAALLVAGCGGSESSGLTKDMQIVEAGNGFGLLLPHRVLTLDSSGQPSTQITAIRTMADLMANVTPSNRVLPTTPFESDAILSTGEAGNHYIYMRFTQPLDLSSIFDQSPSASVNSNLGGQVSLVATDPDSGTTTSVSARIFVNGVTVGRTAVDGLLPFETWVQANGSSPIALDVDGSQPGLGFPGTTSAFQGASGLVRPDTLVAIADSDDDLSTFETFPVGVQIKLRAGNVLSETGNALVSPGLACATVGLDDIQPEVAISTDGLTSLPKVGPTDGDLFDVDPQTSLRIELSEPVQPTSLGRLDNGQPAGASSAIIVTFGPQQSLTTVPFTVRPFSVFDLSIYELIPGFTFPGTGPALAECGDFSQVSISVTPQQIEDLSSNLNTQSAANSFETGEGPGLANAPVAPDVVYIGRVGSDPGISVIDLNGFGASTGSPAYDPLNPIVQGNSNYPNNPNVKIQGNQLVPPLAPGTCTFNGGSQGVFTLTRDSSLNDKLVRKPLIDAVGDMMIGQALDLSFNNGPPPFGCQAGTPNICASSGLKQPSGTAFGNGLAPAQPGQFSTIPPGVGNIIAWAPHPNPPPLVFPPPCVSPLIAGQEPTSIDSTVPPNAKLNLLSPSGDPFGSPDFNVPPSGLLTNTQNAYFQGPSLPQPVITSCSAYSIRQQVGHFLYMIDRVSREVVVLNSNRFTVIDRIPLPDPTSLAMSPNADLLAVSNRGANLVSLIDIDPNSGTFHQVIKSVTVGAGPSGIAWQPDNEDILVCNEGSNSLSIISGFNLEVRNEITTGLNSPFEVAVGPRQNTFGFATGRYYAWILDRAGRVSLYESGPALVTGFGLDDIRQQLPYTFSNPKDIALDQTDLFGSVWVVHERPFDVSTDQPNGLAGGAVSRVANVVIQLVPSGGVTQLLIDTDITASIGPETLTGDPVAIAFDDLTNQAALPAAQSNFSPGQPAIANSKSFWRPVPGGAITTNTPEFMFLAIPNSTSSGGGVIEVIDLASSNKRVDVNVFQPGIQSVAVPGVIGLATYFSQ
jgi:YVTN family beta-propeller protein